MSEKITDKDPMIDALSIEDIKKFGEEMRKINWNDASQRLAIANFIVKNVTNEQASTDLIRQFAEVVQFSEGDQMQFATQKGGKAYVHTPGSAAPRSTIVQRVQTVDAELVSVMLEFELDQLRTGRYGNMNSVKKWAQTALAYKKYNIVWNTLLGSVTAAPNAFTVSAAMAPTGKKSALDDAVDYAEDQIGGAAAIVGRRTDLNFLLRWGDLAGTIAYSDRAKDSILANGAITVYRGIPVIGLNSYKDAYNAEMIASGSIMVVNSTTLKVGENRGLEVLDDVEISTRIWRVHLSEKYGTAVIFPERNAKLTFT